MPVHGGLSHPALTPPAGQRWRAVPGGYDIARYPLTIRPQDGEAANSWVMRAAYTFGIHPRALLTDLGLHLTPQTNPDLPVMFSDEAGHRALARLGLDLGQSPRPGPVQRALGAARRRVHTAHPSWLRPRGLRYCPLCLARDGYWHEGWAEPLYLYCLEHHLPLLETCPHCHTVPFQRPFWTTSLLPVTRCPAFTDTADSSHRYRRRCGFPLDRALTPPRATPGQIRGQSVVLELAFQALRQVDPVITVASIRAPSTTALEAVMILATAAAKTTIFTIDPTSKSSMRRALEAGASLLTAPTPTDAYNHAHRGGLLHPDGSFPPTPAPPHSRARADHNPLLQAVYLRATLHDACLAVRLSNRMGSQSPLPPDSPRSRLSKHQPALHLEAIPHTIDTRILPELDRLGLNTPTGHHVVRVALARYGTMRAFGDIYTALHIPWHTNRQLNVSLRRLVTTGRDDEFLRAIDNAFHRIHGTESSTITQAPQPKG